MKVAQVKPLKLKVETSRPKLSLTADLPYVDVLVDLPFYASTEIYSYSVPVNMDEVQLGSLVSVPLGNSQREGIVLERYSKARISGSIKQLNKVLSKNPVVTESQISLARKMAELYITTSWSFITSMLPEYSAAGEKLYLQNKGLNIAQTKTPSITSPIVLPNPLTRRLREDGLIRDLIILPTQHSSYEILANIAIERSNRGKVVVVLPDEKDILALSHALKLHHAPFSVLSSHQKKSERFTAYLNANFAKHGIFLTLRSGVFLHFNKEDSIIIFNEVESHHYEMRSPTWNTRDVLLARGENFSSIFVSRSPSVEMVQAVDRGEFVLYQFPRSLIKKMQFAHQDRGDESYYPVIREGLRKGNVLISVARTGYINAISCRKCRNVALCECGGKITVPGPVAKPTCGLCGKDFLRWVCSWCSGVEFSAISRGANRSAVEFGRAFPGTRVLSSSGSDQQIFLDSEHTLVIATPGSEPIATYSAIIVLDAQAAYSQIDLRSQEEVRSQWFGLLSMLAYEGEIYFDLPHAEPTSQGLLRGAAYDLARREMIERMTLSLPPATRILVLEGPFSQISLLSEYLESRGFNNFGLESAQLGKARVFVKIPSTREGDFRQLLSSFIRIQAAKGEEHLSLRFNPYSMK